MRKNKQKFNFKIRLFAGLILAFMSIMAIAVDVDSGGNGLMAGSSILMTAGAVASPKLTEKEQVFLDHVKDEVRSLVDKNDKGFLTESKFNESIKSLITDSLKEKPGVIKELFDAVEAQGVELTGIKNKGNQERKSFEQIMRKNLLEDNKQQFDSLKSGSGGRISIAMPLEAMKAAAVMTGAAHITGSTDSWKTVFENTIEGVPNAMPKLLELIQKGTTGKSTISWVERTGGEGAPAGKAEGASYPRVEYDYVEYTVPCESIGAYLEVSRDALDDFDALLSDIEGELMADLIDKIDTQLWDGTGASNQLYGIFNATAAKSTAFTNTVIVICIED